MLRGELRFKLSHPSIGHPSSSVSRYRQEDLYPEEADLSPTDLHDIYLSFLLEAHRLRAVYSSQITLIVGLETDLISPLDLTGLDTLLTTHASHIDYIVGSLHHVHQTPIDFDRPTFDHALDLYRDKGGMAGLVGDYLDGQYEVLSVLRPEVVGHVDLIKLWNPELKLKDLEGVWEKVERNVRFAVAYGALFELNAAAFRKGWEEAYPSWEILQVRLCFVLGEGRGGDWIADLYFLVVESSSCPFKAACAFRTTPMAHWQSG